MSSYDPASYDPSSYRPDTFAAPPPGGDNRTVNVPGRIALIAGVALTLTQVVRLLVLWLLPISVTGGGAVGLRAVNLAFSIGEAGLAVVAVITGAVGLGGRSRPRGAAAAGLALGAASLLLMVFGLLLPWLVG